MNASLPVVLVIEDNALNMELVTGVLESIACRIVAAESAESGLALARADAPAVILLDMRLPGMSGNEAIAVIRSDPALRAIPVIAVTAQAMTGDEARALAVGFDAYVSKPIDSRRLREMVRAYLAQARSA